MLGDPFRFRRLGLRFNPYGTLAEADQRAVLVMPPALSGLLAAGFDHLQILGERGRGKSTLLRLLLDHLDGQGEVTAYEGLPPGTHRYRTDVKPLDSFALDEAQRLNPLARRHLLSDASTHRLILGSHRDFSTDFKRHKLPLTTLYAAEMTDVEHFAAVIQRRLTCCALPDGPYVDYAPDALPFLWRCFGDDLRAAEHALYHYYQQVTPGTISVDDLARFLRRG